MMGKKFMIVKPAPCCGYSKGIGLVFESASFPTSNYSTCVHCRKTEKSDGEIGFYVDGIKSTIQKWRIIWLPDLNEQDELNNIKELEKEN